MRLFHRACAAVETLIRRIVTLLLVLMTVVICYQVVLRYGFQSANIWAEEFARYAFIWVVMLGSANALRNAQHIRIDFAVNALPPAVRRAVEAFNLLLILGFLVALLVYGIDIAMRTGNQISSGLGLPMSVMYMSIPISAAIMLLFAVELALGRLRGEG
ncbi:putative TRAP-type C4-dicarboxylate transporter [uncultured Alphaproteobacteria bacterium]|jgi:C4-dicarboxylate transporter DctQ subunit|uniref:TRAP transporter small permease protein n=1 Tax=uncultured Alphaproteobacteria bacterium TaxID=91750 RepID=A0A212JYJ6_9PROT|nr:putative TRAP-type C4-dicarboxylate transporter [uncultured Alphaproteobacteria bacterium]